MSKIVSVEVLQVDLKPKIKRTDVRNTTGVIGVALVKERTRSGTCLVRYVGSWPKRGKASFSVGLYGENEALKLAVASRRAGLRELGDIAESTHFPGRNARLGR